MMKICLYPHTSKSGIGTYILELAKYLNKKYNLYAIGKTKQKGIKLIKTPNLNYKLYRYTPLGYILLPIFENKIASIVNKNCDIFLTSTSFRSKKIKKKIIKVGWDYPKKYFEAIKFSRQYSSGLFFLYRRFREIENIAYSKFFPEKQDIYLGVSSFITKKIREKGLNAVFIPPGINITKNIRKKKVNKFTICFIGRNHIWTKRKGLKYLLDALMLVDMDYELIIIGNIPFYSKLKFKKYKKIKGKIKLTGLLSREETLKILSKSHLLAAPSLYEEFGYMVLEALSIGVPVIASNNHSFLDMINEDCGIITNIKDKNKFAEDLSKLFDKELLNKMSKSAIERVKKNYSWNVIMPKIENIIKNI